ncbi:MAG: PepSY domain-containing protein [Hyphomicrobium sp.]|nr:PepSY domain-containing protein [Hyphomicrobium sp.]
MKSTLPLFALLTGTLLSAAPALASPECTTEPKDKWLSEEAMKAKVTELGYKAEVFKVEGNCYEIYGYNKDGNQVEVYFNPVSGAVVEEEVEKKK